MFFQLKNTFIKATEHTLKIKSNLKEIQQMFSQNINKS